MIVTNTPKFWTTVRLFASSDVNALGTVLYWACVPMLFVTHVRKTITYIVTVQLLPPPSRTLFVLGRMWYRLEKMAARVLLVLRMPRFQSGLVVSMSRWMMTLHWLRWLIHLHLVLFVGDAVLPTTSTPLRARK